MTTRSTTSSNPAMPEGINEAKDEEMRASNDEEEAPETARLQVSSSSVPPTTTSRSNKFPAVPAISPAKRRSNDEAAENAIREAKEEEIEPTVPPEEVPLARSQETPMNEEHHPSDHDDDVRPGAVRVSGINARQISQQHSFLDSDQGTTVVAEETMENNNAVVSSSVVAEAVDEDQLLGELLSRRGHDVVNAENVATINEESEVGIKKRAVAVAAISVLALIAIAAVITAILVSRRSKNTANKQATVASTIAPHQPTAIKPTNVATITRPTIAPSRPTASPVSSLLQTFRTELLNYNVSSSHNLDHNGTPQNKAFNWLVNHDHFLNASSPVEDVIDRYVLGVLYYADGGNQWSNPSSFLTFRSICLWNAANITGVFCSTASLNNRSLGSNGLDDFIVTKLVLNSNSLIGSIPTEVGVLSRLTYLDLDGNELNGTIPTELGGMTSLTYFALDYNQLTGPIPTELGHLSSINIMFLYENLLNGTIPTELGLLTTVTVMDLSYNILHGTVPTNLAGLVKLEALYLSHNDLSGNLTATLCYRSWGALEADCASGDIECSCCTRCF